MHLVIHWELNLVAQMAVRRVEQMAGQRAVQRVALMVGLRAGLMDRCLDFLKAGHWVALMVHLRAGQKALQKAGHLVVLMALKRVDLMVGRMADQIYLEIRLAVMLASLKWMDSLRAAHLAHLTLKGSLMAVNLVGMRVEQLANAKLKGSWMAGYWEQY